MSAFDESKEASIPIRIKVEKHPVDPPANPDDVYAVDDFPLYLLRIDEEFPALQVPAQRTMEVRKLLSTVLLRRPKLKTVLPVPDNPHQRILVLDPNQNVWESSCVQQVLKTLDCVRIIHTMHLSYDDYTVDEVLRKILPLDEIPSSFESVGPIAHVNLRKEQLPYKLWIAKVLLDKNKSIRTVVNKKGSIANEFRTFDMEVLAGYSHSDWSFVTVKQDHCQFELDFRNVYWNSRLSAEHKRLTNLIKKSRHRPLLVADLMAGIGPFAIPLTSNSNHITVHANDLNPVSFKYLERNAKRNNCQNLHCNQMDARQFVHKLQRDNITIHHVIMNLPASAPEFLNAFQGYKSNILPSMHVYCFSLKSLQPLYTDAVQRCEAALGCNLDHVDIHTVRDVSPTKNMICITFTLPEAVQSLPQICDQHIREAKRARLDDEI